MLLLSCKQHIMVELFAAEGTGRQGVHSPANIARGIMLNQNHCRLNVWCVMPGVRADKRRHRRALLTVSAWEAPKTTTIGVAARLLRVAAALRLLAWP